MISLLSKTDDYIKMIDLFSEEMYDLLYRLGSAGTIGSETVYRYVIEHQCVAHFG